MSQEKSYVRISPGIRLLCSKVAEWEVGRRVKRTAWLAPVLMALARGKSRGG